MGVLRRVGNRLRAIVSQEQPSEPPLTATLIRRAQDERQAQILWWLWAKCYLPAMALDLRRRAQRGATQPDPAAASEPNLGAPAADDAQLAQWLVDVQGQEPPV